MLCEICATNEATFQVHEMTVVVHGESSCIESNATRNYCEDCARKKGDFPDIGTWSDDSKNWQRAFGKAEPMVGVEVIHSWYMRAVRWTEFAWFFELKVSEARKKQILAEFPIKRSVHLSADDLGRRMYSVRPDWFVAKGIDAYDVHQGPGDFFIFMERDGNRSFWTAFHA